MTIFECDDPYIIEYFTHGAAHIQIEKPIDAHALPQCMKISITL